MVVPHDQAVTTASDEIPLLVYPPIDPTVFSKWDPCRFDQIYIYAQEEGGNSIPITTTSDNFRFRLTVIDHISGDSVVYPTAVIIIPAGRESEFLFATRRGLEALASSAQCARLVAVALGRRERHHTFTSSQSIQDELTFVVQIIAQHGRFLQTARKYVSSMKISRMSDNPTIPFMAIDGVGSRNIVAEGESALSGKYIIEQVKVEGRMLRRLYFMDNPFLIQSEVAILESTDIIDKTYLAFDYHKTMCGGIIHFSLTANEASSGLVIGLGGAGLVNFLQHVLINNVLHIIELDPDVVKVAESYFGFDSKNSKKIIVHIDDGLKVGEQDSTTSIFGDITTLFDFIVIDVDSKDNSIGMSCPPQAFLEIAYLSTLKKFLRSNGILVLNVSARNTEMLSMATMRIKSVFETVLISSSDDQQEGQHDLNVVIFAMSMQIEIPTQKEYLRKVESVLQLCHNNSYPIGETIESLEDSLSMLAISGDETIDLSPTNLPNEKGGKKRKKRKGRKK
jgi:hypothetical protein